MSTSSCTVIHIETRIRPKRAKSFLNGYQGEETTSTSREGVKVALQKSQRTGTSPSVQPPHDYHHRPHRTLHLYVRSAWAASCHDTSNVSQTPSYDQGYPQNFPKAEELPSRRLYSTGKHLQERPRLVEESGTSLYYIGQINLTSRQGDDLHASRRAWCHHQNPFSK